MATTLDRTALAERWWTILSYTERPQELFDLFADRLLDRGGAFEDRLPHPGFVGRNYEKGGLLFLGMNPGNGPAGADPAQEPHYAGLRRLLEAPPPDRREAFESLMAFDELWYPGIRIMEVVVGPVLEGVGKGFDGVAYLNVPKWRTQGSANLGPLYRQSMALHTLGQLEVLDLGLIVVLGVGLSRILDGIPDFQSRFGNRSMTVPRTIGDHRLDDKGKAAVTKAIRCSLGVNLEPEPLGVSPFAAPMAGLGVKRPTMGKDRADLNRDQSRLERTFQG